MESYQYLLGIALILFTTKLFGMATRRVNMPQVVGALLAGLILGPAVLGILTETELIADIAELGVIVLMFSAGLGTNIKELKSTGKASFLGALCGVGLSLAAGFGVGMLIPGGDPSNKVYRAVLIGTAISATSVSIAVEALRELGKLNTKAGSTILAAALLDDIIGLVVLTVVMSIGGGGDAHSNGAIAVLIVLAKVAGFAVIAAVVALTIPRFINWYVKKKGTDDLRRFHVFALALCFLMAYVSQTFFGVSDIIGAFVAGAIVGNSKSGGRTEMKIGPLQYLLLTPVFFANVGLEVTRPEFSAHIIILTLAVIAAAVIAKIVGCAIGVRIGGLTAKESIRVGCGMVCRGEVAIIVANKAVKSGVFVPDDMVALILMVIVTSIITPFLIKAVFPKPGGEETHDIHASAAALAANLEERGI